MNASYITPALTLFRPDGMFDFDSQGRLYEHLIRGGVDGILVQGSIGEFFALTTERRRTLAEFSIRSIGHRVKTIIGTASTLPEEIVPFSNQCLKWGADAVMIVPPYYFRMEGEALERFYDNLLERIHGPVYLYNFPDRTGYTIPPSLVLKLASRHSNLAGIKDTISGMDHTRELITVVKSAFPNFEVYSGFDENAAHNVLAGGDGCIGGLSNVVPELCAAWAQAMRSDDLPGIAAGQQTIDRLMSIYAVSPLFIPIIKEAARLRGFVSSGTCTFPMEEASKEQSEQILAILRREGVSLAEK